MKRQKANNLNEILSIIIDKTYLIIVNNNIMA